MMRYTEKEWNFDNTVNGDMTLVAVWKQQQVVPTTYTVSFDANGGTGTMADVTDISGEYTLPDNGFTAPDGKQFKAWSVGGDEKAVGDKITVTADTTVTAVWEDIPDIPQTGDNSMIMVWFLILSVSGIACVTLFKRKRAF